MNEIAQRFAGILEVEGDIEDLRAIQRIEEDNSQDEGITLAEMDSLRAAQEFSGKISLRVPKSLHKDLVQEAKKEGISLNQFILYKLAK
ncbi:MAG: type II toxin-antitoxin system HicB family antitoxin [Defluviitaleaceae bacterium]|nr:type II toxin-antitoxin system HicB family antitoxin [Defluviitaleaceae bacterium]